MKITRNKLRYLLRESTSGMGEASAIERLIKSGDPESIVQAYELAPAVQINFDQIVTNMVKTANVLENRDVDNILYQMDNLLFLAQKAGLRSLGLVDSKLTELETLIHEDTIHDIDMELVYSVRADAEAAIERSIIQTIIAIAKGRQN